MQAVIEDFDLRMSQAKSYLRLLEALDALDAEIRSPGEGPIAVQDDWRRVAKATAFLVIYNLIEAAVRSAFAHLYEQITAMGCTAAKATKLVRAVWIDQQHRLLTPESASPSNYRDSAGRMVDQVLANTVLELSATRLKVSGNLDADAIRELLSKHGVECKAPKKAKGGVDLRHIKDERNALAHGNKTFAESGRDTTVAELQRMTTQVELFMRAVLRSLDSYVKKRRFKKSRRAGVA